MASKMGGFSMAGMKKLQKQLNKLQQSEVEAFVDSCAKELAARLLAKVIKRTPVGDYPKGSGKKGGTLRRGWTSKTHEEAAGGTGKGSIAAGKAYADPVPYGEGKGAVLWREPGWLSFLERNRRIAQTGRRRNGGKS